MTGQFRNGRQTLISVTAISVAIFAAFLYFVPLSWAAPTDIEQAQAVVNGWLRTNPQPLETLLGAVIEKTTIHTDSSGRTLYYEVSLLPSGFVIVSADDRIEPIIAFCPSGSYNPSPENPLGALVSGDMAGRIEQLNWQMPAPQAPALNNSPQKWATLAAEATVSYGPLFGATSISDVRVAPLVTSKWGQTTEGGLLCYNYYTPNNYPTGCVATAMAQFMRYYSYPTAGIGVHGFQIKVDGVSQTKNTLGGNGAGGPYVWADMTLDPDGSTPAPQRQAIGALCHDAGLSVNMEYTSTFSGGSSYDAKNAFVNVFGYGSGVYGYNSGGQIGAGLNAMINPNLDASMPVILAVEGPAGGHAVVCDGYGYDSSTLYHHLNMGWQGTDDAWYNLPTINASYTFNTVDGCVYNVYTSGSGEIISGRVIDMAGNALEGVVVTAKTGSTIRAEDTTDIRGVYALRGLASNMSFTVSASKTGHAFIGQTVSTGQSSDWNAASGNKWGINFTSQSATPPTAYDVNTAALSGSPTTVTMNAVDEGYPNPPAKITYIITTLAEHGAISEPNGFAITGVPYTLTNNAKEVRYTGCAYFVGQDKFTYKANDGGIAPSGGDSNIATVTVNVDNKIYTDYHTDSNTYTSALLDTKYVDCRTQAMYLQSEIGAASTITDLAIKVYILPGQTLKKWTIRMQHTNLAQYPDPSPPYPVMLTTGWTVVYQSDQTISATGWHNFHFQTPFVYNGTQNLMIDFSFNNDSVSATSGSYFIYDAGVRRVVSLKSLTGSHGDPLNWTIFSVGSYWPSSYLPSLKLISTVSAVPLTGDFGNNCRVDLPDFAIFSQAWMSASGQPDFNPACDIYNPKDGQINLNDLVVLVNNWLDVY